MLSERVAAAQTMNAMTAAGAETAGVVGYALQLDSAEMTWTPRVLEFDMCADCNRAFDTTDTAPMMCASVAPLCPDCRDDHVFGCLACTNG